MNDQPELFNSSPYYVPPPPIKIKIRVDSFFKDYTLVLCGLTLDLYRIWKETGHDGDENEFLTEALDDLQDQIISDMYVDDWEEVE
jgi:hypothetical protein